MNGSSPLKECFLSNFMHSTIPRSFRLSEGLRHQYAEPEHLLLAIIALRDGAAFRILAKRRVDFDGLRHKVLGALPPSQTHIALSYPPMSPAWLAVWKAAEKEAPRKGDVIGTGQLLWAILRHFEVEHPATDLSKYLLAKGLTAANIVRDNSYDCERQRVAPGGGFEAGDTSRMRLEKETSWSRTFVYYEQETPCHYITSKFTTDEASISLDQLSDSWPNWSPEEQLDFVVAYSWSGKGKQDILLYIIRHLSPDHRTSWHLSPSLFRVIEDINEATRVLCEWIGDPRTPCIQFPVETLAYVAGPKAIPILESHLFHLFGDDLVASAQIDNSSKRPQDDLGWCTIWLYKLTEKPYYKKVLDSLPRTANSAQHARIALDEVRQRHDMPLSIMDKMRIFLIRTIGNRSS